MALFGKSLNRLFRLMLKFLKHICGFNIFSFTWHHHGHHPNNQFQYRLCSQGRQAVDQLVSCQHVFQLRANVCLCEVYSVVNLPLLLAKVANCRMGEARLFAVREGSYHFNILFLMSDIKSFKRYVSYLMLFHKTSNGNWSRRLLEWVARDFKLLDYLL